MPPVLLRLGERWRASYLESDGATKPWNHAEIKAALIAETDGRCAYCEARMLTVSYGDIEHFYPREHFPALVVSWENLILACSRCNGHKSSKFLAGMEFINPFAEDPREHLFFIGPMVTNLSDRGLYTINELALNEIPRVEGRMRAISNIERLVARANQTPEQATRRYLADLISKVAADSEYSMAVASYLSALQASQLVGEDPEAAN